MHFEVPFDDKEGAHEFYKNVFDWNLIDVPDMSYTIVHTVEADEKQMPKESGAINGGMYKRDEKSAQYPVIIIDVANVDDYVNKVKEAGGQVFREKMQVGGMRFYAQVKDTEENIIGI